jgi:hypothetical protein
VRDLSESTYEAPALRVLGTVQELTLLPGNANPPGKNGACHDASVFVNNSVPAQAYPGGCAQGPNP